MFFVKTTRIQTSPFQTRPPADVAELAQSILGQREAHPETLGLIQVPNGRLVNSKGGPVDGTLQAAPGSDITSLLEEKGWFIQIECGHRRVAAFAHLAESDPAYKLFPINVTPLTDEQMARGLYVENADRLENNPIDVAEMLKRVLDTFGWNVTTLAEKWGLNRATVANKIRLLDLAPDFLERTRRGELSERQADSLVTFSTLPETVRQIAEQDLEIKAMIDRPEIVPSDAIRRLVDRAIEMGAVELRDDIFPYRTSLGCPTDAVRSPTCPPCDQFVSRSHRFYCGDKNCFEVKQSFWANQRAATISQETGVALHPDLLGGATEEPNTDDTAGDERAPQPEETYTEYFLTGEEDALAIARQKNCPHLHLAPPPTGPDTSGLYIHADETGAIAFACVYSEKDHHCQCRQEASDAAQQEQDAADADATTEDGETPKPAAGVDLKEAQALRQEANKGFAQRLQQADFLAWRAILYAMVPFQDRAGVLGLTSLDQVMEWLARLMVTQATQGFVPGQHTLDHLRQMILGWQRTVGWAALNEQEAAMQKWAMVKSSVARLAEAQTTQDDIDALVEMIEASQAAIGDTSLADEISATKAALGNIRPLVDELTADDLDQVRVLVRSPISDERFVDVRQAASPRVLSYALALARLRNEPDRVSALEEQGEQA